MPTPQRIPTACTGKDTNATATAATSKLTTTSQLPSKVHPQLIPTFAAGAGAYPIIGLWVAGNQGAGVFFRDWAYFSILPARAPELAAFHPVLIYIIYVCVPA